ncbi:MAG: sterol desaturase family protein [Bryobacteraceae bacterium]|jgi:sterol desaturase/sphingolipid hydroxylase (fatty acid hydroxylase superfamily)
MKLEAAARRRIFRNAFLSLLIYVLPVLLMFLALCLTGQRPLGYRPSHPPGSLEHAVQSFQAYGLSLFMLALGAVEFSLGLYENHWNKNEKFLDIACFALPHLVTKPLTAYATLKLLPLVLPGMKGSFDWVPFAWGFVIICVADDLTQYWYHRLHHEVPWLWRFHRTHHSAPYMGMAMSSRQNLLYTFFFSQTYLTAALVYVGLGAPSIFALVMKSVVTTMAHSSIRWDKPLYEHRLLHPLAWVLERLVSTPATHHAHHADRTDDGVGFYKGNFGNMFFLWDVIFGTALITRRYPGSYGISHYERDEWYAQLLWPIVKSRVEGSELAADGPVVRQDIPKVRAQVA